MNNNHNNKSKLADYGILTSQTCLNIHSYIKHTNQLVIFDTVTMGVKTLLPQIRHLIEPVQLMYVLMFSVSLIHMDKIYVDKVCQVNLKLWIQQQNLSIEVCKNITR